MQNETNKNPQISSPRDNRPSGWIKPVLIVSIALSLILCYGLYSTRGAFGDRVSTLESKTQELEAVVAESEKRAADLAAELNLVTKRAGLTADEQQRARQLAENLKQKQEQAEQKLASELATKANATDVDTFRQEATAKLTEVQQDANAKLGVVSGEVTGVKQDLAAARQDLSRQLVDVKNTLDEGIARNAAELAQLRKKGERDYFEFDVRKNSKVPFQRVADVQIALTNTDAKKQKYNLLIQADDNRLEKKDRTANEPVQFLVGRDGLRYELVVNSVQKDRIRGYLSTPKDKVLSAEVPTFREKP
jgi:hypothetical protein